MLGLIPLVGKSRAYHFPDNHLSACSHFNCYACYCAAFLLAWLTWSNEITQVWHYKPRQWSQRMNVKGNKYPANLSSNTEAIAAALCSRKLKMVFINAVFFILRVHLIPVFWIYTYICVQMIHTAKVGPQLFPETPGLHLSVILTCHLTSICY